MQFNWTNFFIALAVWLVIAVISIFLFPITTQNTNPDNWDFITHSYKAQTNWTAIIIIGIATLVLFIWLVSTPSVEKSKILRPETIFKSKKGRVQEILARHGITHLDFFHNSPLGEYSIGYLWLSALWNNGGKLSWFVSIGNENYDTTDLRQRFESPILSDSDEFFESIRSAKRHLPPSEKATLESKIKSIYKELRGEGKEFAETIFKKATEDSEEMGEDEE